MINKFLSVKNLFLLLKNIPQSYHKSLVFTEPDIKYWKDNPFDDEFTIVHYPNEDIRIVDVDCFPEAIGAKVWSNYYGKPVVLAEKTTDGREVWLDEFEGAWS